MTWEVAPANSILTCLGGESVRHLGRVFDSILQDACLTQFCKYFVLTPFPEMPNSSHSSLTV